MSLWLKQSVSADAGEIIKLLFLYEKCIKPAFWNSLKLDKSV